MYIHHRLHVTHDSSKSGNLIRLPVFQTCWLSTTKTWTLETLFFAREHARVWARETQNLVLIHHIRGIRTHLSSMWCIRGPAYQSLRTMDARDVDWPFLKSVILGTRNVSILDLFHVMSGLPYINFRGIYRTCLRSYVRTTWLDNYDIDALCKHGKTVSVLTLLAHIVRYF